MSIEARVRLRHPGFELDVDLRLPARGTTALFGPSGSGKTSLLRVIAGLELPAEGYVRVGEDIWQDGARARPAHRRAVGVVFQDARLLPHLSVRGNLDYAGRRAADGGQAVDYDDVVGDGHPGRQRLVIGVRVHEEQARGTSRHQDRLGGRHFATPMTPISGTPPYTGLPMSEVTSEPAVYVTRF